MTLNFFRKRKINAFSVSLADSVANFVGSWKFIIWQSIILLVWMYVNIEHVVNFDPYPFILMNLLLSSQAAYATPMILMSSNRQAEKDREHLIKDLKLDEEASIVLKDIHAIITKIEQDIKLDKEALRDHDVMLSKLNELLNEKNQKDGHK